MTIKLSTFNHFITIFNTAITMCCRINFLLLLFSLPLLIKAQVVTVPFSLDISPQCDFDSITIQSVVTGKIQVMDPDSIRNIEIFNPLDIVFVMAQGSSGVAILPARPIEKGKVKLIIGKENGCRDIKLQSAADKRIRALENFKNLSIEEKKASIISRVEENLIYQDLTDLPGILSDRKL